jgi:ABC-2 type transport system ATP-binding protein
MTVISWPGQLSRHVLSQNALDQRALDQQALDQQALDQRALDQRALARVAGAPGDGCVLDVRDLRMRYGKKDVLEGISFAAHRGEVLALLGPNGAGKTTTIEILEGFRIRSAGEVSVLGVDPAHGGEAWRARLGVVLQSWRDHARWHVRELLAHLGRYYAPYSTTSMRRPWDTDELIDIVGLTEHAGKRVRRLSGGQRRRLDVAIGIVGRPELLFLDEPTAGFDPEARRDFHDLVHRLADREETTILLTTHDLDEAEKLADRILVLVSGHIIADGSADELSRRMSTQAEVRWSRDGQRFVHSADDATGFVRELFRQYGESIEDLEVRRASLEETYMALVRQFEEPTRSLSMVAR